MYDLVFNDEDHTATLDGKPIGRVTSIIRAAGFGVDEKFYGDSYYAQRGRMVHWAIHLLEKGTLDRDSLSDVIRPYVEAWELCKKENYITTLESELDIFCRDYWYCGRCDIRALSPSKLIYRSYLIADIKTGSPTESDCLQTAAYAYPYRADQPIRAAIYLKDDGSYKPKYHDDEEDYSVFLSCVNIYNRKMRGKQ